MRSNVRLITSIIIAVAVIGLFNMAWAETEPKPVWPAFHADMLHNGRNPESTDLENPASLNPIWAFPRMESGYMDDEAGTVDDNKLPYDDPDYFNALSWKADVNEDAWESDENASEARYHWLSAVPSDYDDYEKSWKTDVAAWRLPYGESVRPNVTTGYYRIWVWVPIADDTNYSFTTKAIYRVYDDNGVTEITFDQSNGGTWQLLSERQFSFNNLSNIQNYRVELTNVTDESYSDYFDDDGNWIDTPVRVAADAIKFDKGTGMEIYSSPTSAVIQYSDTGRGVVTGDDQEGYSGPAPVVYIGTIEQPLTTSTDAPEMGAVYCVDSVTPTTDPSEADAISDGKESTTSQYEELSKNLGTPIWRYPDADSTKREPLEGPIEGGVYSTPTVVKDATGRTVCYVAGMDRQVYALDAFDGSLIWKGPGMTVSELGETEVPPTGWIRVSSDHAFGTGYDAGTGTMSWDFSDSVRKTTEDGKGDGWSYSVFAWVPPVSSSESGIRGYAKYKISYDGDSVSVNINQADLGNQGKWVQLGSSYFNVSGVTMEKTSGDIVVADAVMIVPDTIGSFSYSSPAADINKSLCTSPFDDGDEANSIYAVTAAGRVLSFEACPTAVDQTKKLCKVNWVYPDIRHKKEVTGSDDAGEDPLGEVGPAFFNDLLYIGTLGGEIHCVDVTDGTKKWVYMDSAGDDDYGAPMPRGGFTSTPCIDSVNQKLYIGSTEGYFYCLNLATSSDDGSLSWRYPKSDTAEPLGAFRFSTPVIGKAGDGTTLGDLNAFDRVWIGSTDGRVYSFDARSSGNYSDRKLSVTYNSDNDRVVNGIEYFQPNLLSPIQGSIAFSSLNSNNQTSYQRGIGDTTTTKTLYNTMTMYIGDMEGKLNWYSANAGRSDWTLVTSSGSTTYEKKYTSYNIGGELFSSPNVTHFTIGSGGPQVSYVYVATSDGLLVAFSDEGGAWGGHWAGGEWPFPGKPNDNTNRSESLSGDEEIQCDIFPTDFYQNSLNKSPDTVEYPDTDPAEYYTPYSSSTSNNPWSDWGSKKWIISKDMKYLDTSTAPDSSDDPYGYNEWIESQLRSVALNQRSYVFDETGNPRQHGSPVYFEWGETINVFLWNLPAKKFLKNGNSSAFSLSMTNGSSGSSAGSISVAAKRFRIREYSVLGEKASGPESAPILQWADDGITHTKVEDVKRCYAYFAIEIAYTGAQPPSPGPGWNLKVTVQTRESSDSTSYTTKIYPIARLQATSPPKPLIADEIYQAQDIGINNPLAMKDDQSATQNGKSSVLIAWPPTSGTTTNYRTYQGSWESRAQADAHYNGNARLDLDTTGTTSTFTTVMPVINLDYVNHGSSSREAWLGVMDRSAVGTRTKKSTLNNFRVYAGELKFNGGEQAIVYSFPSSSSLGHGVKFPWEMGIGSADYPNISSNRESFVKATDGDDPAAAKTSIPAVYLAGSSSTTSFAYDDATMRPDTVFVSVEVPRFQPANVSKGYSSDNKILNSGYSKRMEAYIDSDSDGKWDSGDVVLGKPTVYQEAYRRFTVGVYVPPDPKIEVVEQTIDIGDAPHGLGIGLTGNDDFCAYNPEPDIAKWFKTVTIKNAGNVNLPHMYIGRNVRLFSDQAGATSLIPYNSITSSLDGDDPSLGIPPYTTSGYGYTLTKPRVGDPDPSVLTIPDKRKYDMNYDSAKDATEAKINNWNNLYGTDLDTDEPLSVKVGLTVPLTQPIGNYYSYDTTYRTPYVPVFSDMDSDGVLDTSDDPVAESSFQLKVNVRENQLTGGVTPKTLPEIDSTDTRVGDATPAAYRDTSSGNVYLYWSSNRDSMSLAENETEFASAPWFITRATLNRDGSSWSLNDTSSGDKKQWWQFSNDTLPSVQWPTVEGSSSDEKLMTWHDSSHYSVRHHSPFITQKLTSSSVKPTSQTWMAWVGTADMQDDVSGASVKKTTQDNMIFYKDITDGSISGNDRYISHDKNMVKRYPSLAVYGSRAWMFWQGGNNNKWSIMYSSTDNLSNPDDWLEDAALLTPDCLSSVSEPNCIFRRFWGNLGSSGPDYSDGRQLLDIAYAGTSKYDKASDILLGRYTAKNETDVANSSTDKQEDVKDSMPCNMAQPLPRVFDEKLQRDSQYGFYTSKHLAWVRPDLDTSPKDNWDGYSVGSSNYKDVPYIHVVLPAGYTLPDDSTKDDDIIISATDGSIKCGGNWLVDPTDANYPSITVDSATGIYTYTYPNATTKAILGNMLVDFSAGVVRFTEPLNEVKTDDGFIAPEVRADYTPRTWRLTADSAVDNSPRVFIERTNMNSTTNPGLGSWSADTKPVDRMWVFWRKEGTGVKTSTIYQKTYRVGIDLAKLGKPAIPMNSDGSVSTVANINISGSLGPWEVDKTGTKIFFTEVDERYRSLLTSGSKTVLGSGPGDITISYKVSSDSAVQHINADDIYWIEELPEQSLLKDGNVNEGSIWAFADPVYSTNSGTLQAADSSKIWVFWTSTRGGTSDLFWETVSPNF